MPSNPNRSRSSRPRGPGKETVSGGQDISDDNDVIEKEKKVKFP